jgi:PST family polysaccharide transporter
MTDSSQVTTRLVKNIKWTAFIEIAARIVSPLLLIILAKLIAPEYFGLVSTATIAITFFNIFWDAGLSKALVQDQQIITESANVIFWANLCLSFVVYILLFFSAPAIAGFFNSPGSELVIRVLGVQLIIGSLGSVQQNLQVREINYKPLFFVRLFTAIVPALVAIPMALLDFRVWALVAGNLSGSILGVIFLWIQSSWRPSVKVNFSIFPRLLRFGLWVMFEGLLGWFISMGDNLWVGHFLGTQSLGIYQVGWSISTVIFSIALSPLISMLFPAFSRLSGDDESRNALYWKAVKLINSLCLPMGIGLFFTGGYIERVLVNQNWSGLGAVISWIGLMMGISWTVGVNTELYRAIGRPDVNTKIVFICVLYYAPVYYFASQLGLPTFIIFRFIVAFLALPIHYILMTKILKISVLEYFKNLKSILLALLVMVLILTGIIWADNSFNLIDSSLVMLIVLVFTGFSSYLGMLLVLDKKFIIGFINLIKEVTRKEKNA